MKRALLAFCIALIGTPALAQLGPSTVGPEYAPNFYRGYVPTPYEWQLIFSNKLDYNPAGLPISLGGCGATTVAGCVANLGVVVSALASGDIYVGNVSNIAAPVAPSGDLSMTNAGVFSVNGLSHVTNASLANSGLVHPSTTVAGQSCTLGSSCAIAYSNLSVGAPTMTSTTGGLAPTPPNNTTTFLRGDGTFAAPAAPGGNPTACVAATATNGVALTLIRSDGAPPICANINLPGSPTTTTQAPLTNNTSVATTAYTDAAVTAIVGGKVPFLLATLTPSNPGATFTGIISTTVLTASSVTGTISIGDTVYVANTSLAVTITSFGTGSGGAGTYNLSGSATHVSAAMASGSSTIIDTTHITSTYKSYEFKLLNMSSYFSGTDVELSAFVSINGGVSYDTTGSNYLGTDSLSEAFLAHSSNVPAANSQANGLLPPSVGQGSMLNGISGSIRMFNPSASITHTADNSVVGSYFNSSLPTAGAGYSTTGGVVYGGSTSPINAIEFTMTNGPIISGSSIEVWGVP